MKKKKKENPGLNKEDFEVKETPLEKKKHVHDQDLERKHKMDNKIKHFNQKPVKNHTRKFDNNSR